MIVDIAVQILVATLLLGVAFYSLYIIYSKLPPKVKEFIKKALKFYLKKLGFYKQK